MKEKAYAKPVMAFIAAVLIGVAFTGSPPSPLTFVHDTCHDGIDNDVDGVYGGSFPLVIADSFDGECIWMPLESISLGEYDGQGLNDPYGGLPEVDAYVLQWQNVWSEETPTHFEMVKALYAFDGRGPCQTDLQDSLDAYKNGYGLPNSMTGALEHQAECGVSY